MGLALRDYHKFYNTKHGNRVLSWAHYLATTTLTSNFPKGAKELSVSLYQAIVLLLFNEKTSWKAEEIQEATGLNDDDLMLTLQSLALGKKRVLTKKGSMGKAVEKEDLFTFNAEFTDVKYRVHVNSIQQNESVSGLFNSVSGSVCLQI
jgi:cullin 4